LGPWLAKHSLKNSWASTAGTRSGGIRNPRTIERSGCTPAEPYPLNRNKKIKDNEEFSKKITFAFDKPHTCLWAFFDFQLVTKRAFVTGCQSGFA
jgi:hypothetical protein